MLSGIGFLELERLGAQQELDHPFTGPLCHGDKSAPDHLGGIIEVVRSHVNDLGRHMKGGERRKRQHHLQSISTRNMRWVTKRIPSPLRFTFVGLGVGLTRDPSG